MAPADIEDIMLGLHELDTILILSHSNRIAFPLRSLRYCAAIHSDNPVPEDSLASFNLTGKQPNGARLKEQIWFLVFIRTVHQETQKIPNQFHEQKARMISSFSPTTSQDARYAQPSFHTLPIVIPNKTQQRQNFVSVIKSASQVLIKWCWIVQKHGSISRISDCASNSRNEFQAQVETAKLAQALEGILILNRELKIAMIVRHIGESLEDDRATKKALEDGTHEEREQLSSGYPHRFGTTLCSLCSSCSCSWSRKRHFHTRLMYCRTTLCNFLAALNFFPNKTDVQYYLSLQLYPSPFQLRERQRYTSLLLLQGMAEVLVVFSSNRG